MASPQERESVPGVGPTSRENLLGGNTMPLAFGTAAYGATFEKDSETGYFLPTDEGRDEGVALMRYAIRDLGYTHIDTARAYGDSEPWVGDAIRGFPRGSLFIATKVGIRPRQDPMAEIMESITRLGIKPDLIYVHDRMPLPQLTEYIKALDLAVDRKLTDRIGMSNLQPQELLYAIDMARHPITHYQAKLNLINPRRDGHETLKICRENGITFMGSAALNNQKDPPQDDPYAREKQQLIKKLAEKHSMTPAQVGIYAVRALGAIPIVQSHKLAHMAENKKALDFEMSPRDTELLRAILLRNESTLF